MEFIILAVLGFLFQIPDVTPLECYHCREKSASDCLDVQKVNTCKLNENGACYSLSYEVKKSGNYMTRFIKGCWKSYADCKNYCSNSDAVDDYENCKIKCCVGENCNEFEKEVVKENRKRSTDQNNTADKTQLFSMYFIFCITSFVHFLIRY